MKLGRNEPCYCGSGKKYKKCCLVKDQSAASENDSELQEDYDDEDDMAELLLKAGIHFHRRRLDRKPHIKEYKKVRRLHSEIVNGMIKYYEEGSFEHKFNNPYPSEEKRNVRKPMEIRLLEADFDIESREGAQAFYDMMIYKSAPNANCITEEFIESKRYRKPEKIEFLQSMLDSKLGLFEVTETDSDDGYVYIKEVFTGEEYKLTDTSMSYNNNSDNYYIYTRVLTHHGISINTGLSLMFKKTDRFIQDFIKREQTDYKPLGEYVRFIELYNRFSKDSKKIKVIPRSF